MDIVTCTFLYCIIIIIVDMFVYFFVCLLHFNYFYLSLYCIKSIMIFKVYITSE